MGAHDGAASIMRALIDRHGFIGNILRHADVNFRKIEGHAQ